MSDILVEIPDSDLLDLFRLYQEKATWAPYMVALIHNGLKWKKSDKFKKLITFLSPNNSWKIDGTIIVLLQIFSLDIHVFTLDPDCTNLYNGLLKTSLIPYNNAQFYSIHEKCIPTVKKFIENKNLNILTETPCFLYSVSPEKSQEFVVDSFDDFTIKKLQPENAEQINNLWPHRFQNSDQYISGFIEINGGYGVFGKKTNKLVAWVIRQSFGNMTMLQTENDYQRRGFASAILKRLAKEIGAEGFWACGTVLVENLSSVKLFEKLGFQRLASCSYITCE